MGSNYILELKTGQASNIKILFEVLKEVLLSDINIIFTPTNIKVVQIDGSNIALVHLNLKSEAFEYYNCTKPRIIIGLSTSNFYKIIKISKNDDMISLFIEEHKEDKMLIKIENSNENRIFESNLALLDVPIDNIDIPTAEFDEWVTLPASKFQKHMKDLNSLGIDCQLEIQIVDNQLMFACEGDFSRNKIILGISDNIEFHNKSNKIIQGKFLLKFLILFTKATSLGDYVHMYLKNDFPLILEYTVGTLGSLRFILGPISN